MCSARFWPCPCPTPRPRRSSESRRSWKAWSKRTRPGSLNRARELIDGNTLIELGLQPGPFLGEVLNKVHDRILSGEITTREEAIAAARALIAKEEGRTPPG